MDPLPASDDEPQEFDPFAHDEDEAMRDVERHVNVHRLKGEVQKITGVAPTGYENPEAPAEVVEGFWQSVVEWERAPDTTHTAQWQHDHPSLPPDAELNDEQVHSLLWQIIEWMATRRTYLEDTNHLSDRELYRHLRDEAMHEWTKELSPHSRMNYHMSPIGSGSEEDNALYMRFYADDSYRDHWAKQFPKDLIPEHEYPPCDRDRLLPQADYAIYDADDEEVDSK